MTRQVSSHTVNVQYSCSGKAVSQEDDLAVQDHSSLKGWRKMRMNLFSSFFRGRTSVEMNISFDAVNVWDRGFIITTSCHTHSGHLRIVLMDACV